MQYQAPALTIIPDNEELAFLGHVLDWLQHHTSSPSPLPHLLLGAAGAAVRSLQRFWLLEGPPRLVCHRSGEMRDGRGKGAALRLEGVRRTAEEVGCPQ